MAILSRDSKLKDFGVPEPVKGVLHPAMANRFQVRINDRKLITEQVTCVTVDILKEEFKLEVQQPVGLATEMLREISSICNRFNLPFAIDFLDGCGNTYSSISGFCKVTEHQLVLDYALNDQIATHHLTFTYVPSAL